MPEPGDLLKAIDDAISNPGGHVAREPAESVRRWQARAVHALVQPKLHNLRDRLFKQIDRAEAAEDEVNRLTAGASDEPPREGTHPIPSQLIHMWNAATPEQRLRYAEQVLVAQDAAERCQAAGHDTFKAERDRLKTALARVYEWAHSNPVHARTKFGDGYREALRDIRDLLEGKPVHNETDLDKEPT